MPVKKFTVDKHISLSTFSREKGFTKDQFFMALEYGGVMVNRKRVSSNKLKLNPGDIVSICHDETPPDFSFDKKWVVYEDNSIIVMNKPHGMTTQGTQCFDINHLFYFVKQYLKGYAGLHHRLDRDTSGLVMFSKKKSVNIPLSDLFYQKKIVKEYYAVVYGHIDHEISITEPIGKVPGSDPSKFWVHMPHPKEAETSVIPIFSSESYSLVKAVPVTGRTHQIRVHMASLKHPIVGDQFYNKDDMHRQQRHLLHCRTLKFPHPESDRPMLIEADFPEDFISFCGKVMGFAL